MAFKTPIGLFLHYAKQFVSKNGIIFIPRDQNVQYMTSVGMTIKDLEDLIFALDTVDCVRGPEPDKDPTRAAHWLVAIFCPIHNGVELYLKISIRMDKERCKCLSIKLSDRGVSHE